MMNNTERFYLGIDGGGTKTDFLLCDRDGKEISRCTLAGCNPVDIGIDKTKEILHEGICRVCDGIPYGAVSLYAGIAGGISGDNREKLYVFLSKFGFARVRNNSDAMNAAAAGLKDRDGVAAVMGTGCVAFTKNGGEYIRTGGLGYLLDAGGDGYSIGRDALRHAMREEQRGNGFSLLTELIRKRAAADDLMAHLSEIYSGGKAYIASFCPAVFEAMRAGDVSARKIIETNAALAAELIREAAGKLREKQGTVLVVLIGGVAAQPEIIPMLERILGTEYRISFVREAPVTGAVRMAMEEESC